MDTEGAAMSVIDLRTRKDSEHRVRKECGLRIRGQLPNVPKAKHLDLALLIADFLALGRTLTSRDQEIFEALRSARSIRGATRELPPDRPASRAYVMKRLRRVVQLSAPVFDTLARELFGVTVEDQDSPERSEPSDLEFG
jgi:hypothetical protein